VTFETGSRLQRIEEDVFLDCVRLGPVGVPTTAHVDPSALKNTAGAASKYHKVNDDEEVVDSPESPKDS
jgi:hypothetical protein